MKFIYVLLLTSLIALVNTGCVGTIYSAAVDERNVKTIANDTSIELSILKKLSEGESSDIIDVSVSSYEGKVFLVGEYENSSQKNRFLSASKSVEGVKSVDSYFLQVNETSPCGTKENLSITVKVKSNLIGDKTIWSTNVHVSTMQCQVVLWGTVGTPEEVSKSIEHAKKVEGVKSVKSFLKTSKK